MTTDITELAQSLKAAAEKATQGNWRAFKYHDGRCGIGGSHNYEIMVCEHISKERPHDAMFIALVNPANVITLVEALEKAQAQSSKLLEAYHKAVSIGARYEERISELESRTVKLPEPTNNKFWRNDWDATHFMYATYVEDLKVELSAAGIKWEDE